jgi:hypothetical protein
MANEYWKGLGSVALTLVVGIAMHSPAEAQTLIRESKDPTAWRPESRAGNAVTLGGGFGNFTGDYVRDQTGPVGAWGVRLMGGTRSVIGGEFGYVGGINRLAGTGNDDFLLSTSFDGALRFGWPVPLHSALIAPFAFGGLGWTHYNLLDDGPSRGVLASESDNQLIVPMGVGFGFGYRGFMAEARGTYRQAFDEDLFGSRDMSIWSVSLSVGGEY